MSKTKNESNIQTFLRIRPSKTPSGFFAADELEKDSINVVLPDNYHEDYINNSKLRYSFHFNGVLEMNASQDDVFQRVGAPAVLNALEGFNSTIFAYGQTGSGKV
jgi:kinesin family protein 6/9